jgi:hypothetical protein
MTCCMRRTLEQSGRMNVCLWLVIQRALALLRVFADWGKARSPQVWYLGQGQTVRRIAD